VKRSVVFSDKEKAIFWKYLIWKLYKKLSVFYFGAISLVLVTTITKYTTGRLRPNFIDLCQPDIDCGDNINKNDFIENYTCTNGDKNQILDARMSFVSGHSTYSSYCAIYFCIYLQMEMKSYLLISLRTVLQLMSILAALFSGLNRIAINKHHWSDVFAGLMLGTICAIVTTKYLTGIKNQNQLHYIDSSFQNNITGDSHEMKVTKKLDSISQC